MPVTATNLKSMIQEELESLKEIRHDLHAHPELGYEEHRTSEVIQRELKNADIEFTAGLAGGTGVVGHIHGKSGVDKAIGLRADIDALPIQEQTGLPYASKTPGKMHACGHDGHTTILIGTARVLAKLAQEQKLPRPVTFLFQPAEEGGAGAKRMIDDGCLNGNVLGPPIETIFGLHGWPWYKLGSVGTRPGPMLATSDRFEVTVHGVGSHAAFPHTSKDCIVATAAIIMAIQTVASRNVDPLDPVVISTTIVNAGTASNVIPPYAKIWGSVRTLGGKVQDQVEARLGEVIEQTAKAYGCTADYTFHRGYPVTSNDPEAVNTFNRIASQTLGEENVKHLPRPVMVGEDFSFYGQLIPSCFFALGLIPPGKSSMPELHQPNFNFNDDAIPIGIELFCKLALNG